MDATVLIDAIVRQTTVLIAQLATAAGGRAPLAHMANQVFIELVRELKQQGLGNKVIADMFGLALRTYHDKVRRLSESSTVRGRSLWEAALEYIQQKEVVLQVDVLNRFRRDDEALVRGVLSDLVDSGMIFRSGKGNRTTYRAAKPEEYDLSAADQSGEAAANLVWVAVSRFGPATSEAIAEAVPLDGQTLDIALNRLVGEGRISRVERGDRVEYQCERCVIPFGTPAGWEAAVYDHYQAMVTALCIKLSRGTTAASADDRVGGSTFSFTVWEGHPHHEEVVGLLQKFRAEAKTLRQRVSTYNERHPSPDGAIRVLSYMGQAVLEPGYAEEERT